ncbi:MAG: hypothetical protein ACK4WJ_01750 [Endomicrobiia bacterium]
MKKFFVIFCILILKVGIIFGIYVSEYSFVGYPQESSVIFLNPAAVGKLGSFNLDISYAMMFRDVIEEDLYNTEFSLSYNTKNNFFIGLGFRDLVLQDIFSESLLLGSFGVKLFNKKIFPALSFKYYIFKYFYDEYYLEDILAEDSVVVNNIDFGVLWKIKEDIFLSFSVANLINNSLGKDIQYSLPQRYVLGLGYSYATTIFNLEYHIIKNIIDQKSLYENNLKICIKQEMFYTNKISMYLVFELNRQENFDNFVLGTEMRFLQNNLGLRYFCVYPVSFASQKGFFGNHYINFNLSLGKKPTRKIIKHKLEKEEVVVLEEPKVKKDEKIVIEKPKQELVIADELQKIEVSTVTKPEIFKEKEQIYEKTQEVSKKDLEFKESQVIKPEVKITTKTVYVDIIKKNEQKEKYKFPLAHKVLKGETLISISKKYYNNEKGWRKIYEANKDKIIKGIPIVGEILIIPEP